jgi:fucose 4-O-acetylase-like acetyltransferase
MHTDPRIAYLDNLRVFLIFLVVLVHAGVVYESSGVMGPYWIVDDPSTSDLPGLVNLVLDLFVMPTLFFISGYFTPASLERKGGWLFLKRKIRRLLVPWLIALFTLIPLYNALWLYSRGLPQEGWATYFHFSNERIGMNWLWFLPVLFVFDALYLLLRKLNLPTGRWSVGWSVTVVFLASIAYCELLSALGWLGWTKTPLIDFQNERLLPYFLIFLLGALCRRRGTLENRNRNRKLYITVQATVWIPIQVYLAVLLNFWLRPGQYIVSANVDGLVLWIASWLSTIGLLYCAVTTFKYYFRRRRPLGKTLSRLSYGVYIIHIAVMGPIALVLLHTDLPALLKYPLLTLATYVGSNLVVWVYTGAAESLAARPGMIQMPALRREG